MPWLKSGTLQLISRPTLLWASSVLHEEIDLVATA